MKLYNLMLTISFTILLHVENADSSSENNVNNIDLQTILKMLNVKTTPNSSKIAIKYNYHEDIHLPFPRLVAKYGYPVEEHEVKTSDGYLLTMFRIPKKGPAVLIVIGPLVSSDDFVTIGSQAGLAYQLADAGFDVWLGNCRGNKYSLRHVILPTDSAAYWDFTFDEMGRYDTPALIDYILNMTNKKDLKLLGYSQSNNAILVLCSEKPEYNNKISLIILLSPTIFIAHTKTPILRLFAGQYTPDLYLLAKPFGVHSLFGGSVITPFFEVYKNIFCDTPETAYDYCHQFLFSIFGLNHDQVNTTSLPIIYGHFPTSCSIKTLQHYIQLIRSGKFRRYDSGKSLNVMRYGSLDPPEYSLEKITAKVAIAWAGNDWFCVEEDLQILLAKLPNVTNVYKVPHKGFSHADYLFAKDVKTLLYDKLIEMLRLN